MVYNEQLVAEQIAEKGLLQKRRILQQPPFSVYTKLILTIDNNKYVVESIW